MSEQPRRRRQQQMPDEEPIIPNEEEKGTVVQKAKIIAPTIPLSITYESPKYDIHTKAGLLEYIKTAIELETDLATQERIVAECQSDIRKRKPTREMKRMPSPPILKENEYETASALSFLGAVIFAIIFLFSSMTINFELFFVGIIITAPFALAGWFLSKASNKINSENHQLQEAYNQVVEEIRARNNMERKKHDAALYECDISCRAIAEISQPHIDETRSILSRLYSKGVIYPKYCNLPALTSIYEYYMTGRCEELTGPHGAYNLYEDEVRKDTVISQLNTVIENLERIRQTQYLLYEQVCSIQQNTAAIRSELAQIKGYTIQIAELSKLNAYYAARTEVNTRITMYYHL